MGVWLLWISLVLVSSAGFAFWGPRNPCHSQTLNSPTTQTAELQSYYSFICTSQPSFVICIPKENAYRQQGKKNPNLNQKSSIKNRTTKLLFHCNYCCFGIRENINLHQHIWVPQCSSKICQGTVQGMESRLHRSSGRHQRVAKHFREQLTEAQAKRCDAYLHLCLLTFWLLFQLFKKITLLFIPIHSIFKMLPCFLHRWEGKLTFQLFLPSPWQKLVSPLFSS